MLNIPSAYRHGRAFPTGAWQFYIQAIHLCFQSLFQPMCITSLFSFLHLHHPAYFYRFDSSIFLLFWSLILLIQGSGLFTFCMHVVFSWHHGLVFFSAGFGHSLPVYSICTYHCMQPLTLSRYSVHSGCRCPMLHHSHHLAFMYIHSLYFFPFELSGIHGRAPMQYCAMHYFTCMHVSNVHLVFVRLL